MVELGALRQIFIATVHIELYTSNTLFWCTCFMLALLLTSEKFNMNMNIFLYPDYSHAMFSEISRMSYQ